jgi:ABC-2 type transport system ATP-binding protein
VQDEARTVLFSSQNTLDVEQIADRITFIDRGHVVDADDTAAYLDRWRRVRLELPAGAVMPDLAHVVASQMHGRTAVVTTDRFTEAFLALCRSTGATVHGVDRMTLEEIFVAAVMARREEAAR